MGEKELVIVYRARITASATQRPFEWFKIFPACFFTDETLSERTQKIPH